MLKVSKVTGQGWVTGVTVPDGIIRVRRKGVEFWTGNSGRAESGPMTQEDQPAKGSEGQAKRLGGLEVSALLSHSATEVLKDAMAVRGTRNEDYWNSLKLGRPLPPPGVPFIYDKFINLLKAGGVNVTRKGDSQVLATLTDDDIAKMSRGAVTNADTVESSNLSPIKGGLFDESLTGGSVGRAWSHIELPEPMPNPAMEEPIRRLLGLTQQGFRDVLARRAKLPDGGTGGAAMKDALGQLNIDALIEKYRDEALNARGAKRDNAVKCLRYLVNTRKQGVAPERWMLTKVPVIPPIFRPISRMGDVLLVSDMNDLYRDVLESTRQIKEAEGQVDDGNLADDRERLYDAVSGVFGWGEPISKEHQAKGLKGAVRQIFGTGPKWGLAQSKLFSKTVGMVGRGVVTPNPDFDMDTVGIPDEKAWELYRPFVLRRLIKRGFPPVKAAQLIDEQHKEAADELDKEMAGRPVLLNRAPTWHKFNILAFNPVRVKGKVIQVSPLIVSGFNMDFDGDQANFHVPVSDEAVKQARERMLPSSNLFKLTDLRTPAHAPAKEMLLGLYQMTRPPKKMTPVRFDTAAQAQEAYNNGLIDMNTPIIVSKE